VIVRKVIGQIIENDQGHKKSDRRDQSDPQPSRFSERLTESGLRALFRSIVFVPDPVKSAVGNPTRLAARDGNKKRADPSFNFHELAF
jgi:hypothetical protein